MTIRLLMGGGLGNQLFQYAACRALCLDRGYELVVDTRFYANARRGSAKDLWINHFPLTARIATAGPHAHSPVNRLMRKVFEPSWRRYSEPGLGYDAQFSELPDGTVISGNFNSPQYFQHRWREIANEFILTKLEEQLPKFISGRPISEYVAVHVRRGDYVGDPRFEMIDAEDYYRKALRALEGYPVLVFSDDLDYCGSQPWLAEAEYFDPSEDRPPFFDLFAMSQCAAIVIANSSFSWWAGWIGFQRGAHVYAPGRWIDGHASRDIDILPVGWTEISFG